jgi:tyrosyl-tRNA synthetase
MILPKTEMIDTNKHTNQEKQSQEITADEQKQIDYLMSGKAEILPGGQKVLLQKIRKAKSEKRPLRVKLGIDPTGADLHLGHTVCLQALRRFQDLGHQAVLIIGGFTAQLGDPTGRNEARPPLTGEQVKQNAETFLDQVKRVLDLSKVEVVNNADWLSDLKLGEILKLASTTTINQLIAKEAFGERLEQGHPLYVHELFYPILQGYDSVIVKSDIEIGGQDQRFNVLAGRDMQKHFEQEPQIVMLLPLLIGLDGKKKMSKTSDNYIGLTESPNEIFGKTMSLPDSLLLDWYQLVNSSSPEEIELIKNQLAEGANPRDIKMNLASKLVELYYSSHEAQAAKEDFIAKFQKREIPAEIPKQQFVSGTSSTTMLLDLGWVQSKGEAKRLIQNGGIRINEQKISEDIPLRNGDIVQMGKRKFMQAEILEKSEASKWLSQSVTGTNSLDGLIN